MLLVDHGLKTLTDRSFTKTSIIKGKEPFYNTRRPSPINILLQCLFFLAVFAAAAPGATRAAPESFRAAGGRAP